MKVIFRTLFSHKYSLCIEFWNVVCELQFFHLKNSFRQLAPSSYLIFILCICLFYLVLFHCISMFGELLWSLSQFWWQRQRMSFKYLLPPLNMLHPRFSPSIQHCIELPNDYCFFLWTVTCVSVIYINA